MNSFYHFKTALHLKQKNKAMLILRDKNESIARKIMEKAKIQVPDYKGRLFWQWTQNFIFRACTLSEENNASLDFRENNIRKETAVTQPRSDRYGEGHRAGSDDYRPHQYHTDAGPPSGVVCTGESGVPAVHPGLGHACHPCTPAAAVQGKPALDMGNGDTTGIHSDVSGSHSLVCTEYPVRVRQCHTGAGVAAPGRSERHARRSSAHDPDGVATDAGELRRAGSCTGIVTGHLALRSSCRRQRAPGIYPAVLPAAAQRRSPFAGQHAPGAGFCHHSDAVASSCGRQAGHAGLPLRGSPVHARHVLLAGLSRTPGVAVAHSHTVITACDTGQLPAVHYPDHPSAGPAQPERLQGVDHE